MATTTTVSRPPAPSTVLYPGSALYIGNLHSDITEAILFEKFSTAGPVLSIRVCRDMITRRSLGYGYINYQNAADAERALDTMNFDVMKGKQIRLMWSQRDPSLRKSGVGNIFMKNLDTSIDNKALYDTFSAFGNILSCKVATDEAGNSKGYGFVHFETEEGAGQAIKKVNGMLLNGKKVFVGKFIPRLQRSHEQGEKVEKFNNVFVKNFGDELDEAKMCEMFTKFGKIVSSRLMTDGEGKSKGFGFVAFETPESAESAVQGINGLELNGNTLFCGPAMTKARRQVELKKKFEALKAERENRCHGVNLYVKNLDDIIDDDRLVKEFSAFGTIASFKIMTDEEGRSKGFGFVCFTSPEEATSAVTELNGRIIGTKPLYVALAQRKEERKAHLATQYMQRLANMRMQRVPHPGYSLRPNGAVMNASPLFVPPSTRFLPPSIPQQFGPPPRWSMAGQPTPLRGPSGPYQAPNFIPGAASLRPRISMQSTRPTYRMNYPGRASAGGPLISTPPVVGMSDRSAGGLDVGHRHHTPAFQSTSTSGLSYQYTSSARNAVSGSQPQQQAVPPRQPPPEPAVVIEGQEPLTSSMLVAAPVEQQKQMLGERLYPIIRSFFPEHAGKITGMLLEIDNSELLHLLENPPIMEAKIREANTVLQFHMDKRAAAGAAAASSKNRG